jgi:hypothetical protein
MCHWENSVQSGKEFKLNRLTMRLPDQLGIQMSSRYEHDHQYDPWIPKGSPAHGELESVYNSEKSNTPLHENQSLSSLTLNEELDRAREAAIPEMLLPITITERGDLHHLSIVRSKRPGQFLIRRRLTCDRCHSASSTPAPSSAAHHRSHRPSPPITRPPLQLPTNSPIAPPPSSSLLLPLTAC